MEKVSYVFLCVVNVETVNTVQPDNFSTNIGCHGEGYWACDVKPAFPLCGQLLEDMPIALGIGRSGGWLSICKTFQSIRGML